MRVSGKDPVVGYKPSRVTCTKDPLNRIKWDPALDGTNGPMDVSIRDNLDREASNMDRDNTNGPPQRELFTKDLL